MEGKNMCEEIKQIIAKVRQIYKYDETYKEIVSRNPSIHLSETRDGEIQLDSIRFSWYDSMLISKSGIWYTPSYGDTKAILKYRSFEEFLKL